MNPEASQAYQHANAELECAAAAAYHREHLDELAYLDNTLICIEEAIATAVRNARTSQRTWAEIGEALRITPQGAQQRYGRRTKP